VLVRQFVVPGLGHLSTLLADESSGVAAVIDPRRDIDVYLDAAHDADVRITTVVETHLHNDYVSGARELAALTGAAHVIGAGAELRYEHRPLRHGDTFDVGYLRFTALETPGHTPEHVAYAVVDASRAGEPVLLFTGGSLLVGAVGRTDLLGAEHAVPYAHAMHRSLRDVVLPHADHVAIYPTHGAGSLCSTGISSTPWSTIGFERRHNPMVRPIVEGRDIEVFVETLLGRQPSFPAYFARMRPTNQDGPAMLGARVPDPRPLDLDEAKAAVAGGALIVDLREPSAFAFQHIPGSRSIPAGPSFGTWLGWLVEPDRPLVLILDDPARWDDAIRQTLRIGHEVVLGHLRGGIATWTSAGEPVEAHDRLTVQELGRELSGGGHEAPFVIDVRQATEYASSHVPGSIHVAAGDLPARLADLPRDRPIAAICGSGYRASVAASLLAASGFERVAWVADGVPAWKAAGLPVERGEGRAGELPAIDATPDPPDAPGDTAGVAAHTH
jgi:hydroxyacylglutathione hydrolase